MSEWGAIFTALEAEIRTAVPDLPSSSAGFERSDGLGEDLPASKLPHVYTRSVLEGVEIVTGGYGAKQVTILFTFALWTRNEDQEAVSVRLDAIRDQIDSNRTLGGLVDLAMVSARQISEFPDRDVRKAEFLIQAEVER